jgi:hypothetical protein
MTLLVFYSQILDPIVSVKKIGYYDSYIQYGFTSIIISGAERPQCVTCSKALSNDSMKPTKLKQHLQNVHPQHKDKDKSFFEHHGNALKKMKLDSTGAFQEMNHRATEASYAIALEIAKQKKPHTIGETLIKPCILKWWKLCWELDWRKNLQHFHYQTVLFGGESVTWPLVRGQFSK